MIFHCTVQIENNGQENLQLYAHKWICLLSSLKYQNVIYSSLILQPKILLKFNLCCCFFQKMDCLRSGLGSGNYFPYVSHLYFIPTWMATDTCPFQYSLKLIIESPRS
jgi:hypothetical protein